MSRFQEKFLALIYLMPVPKTNTRAQGEYPKANKIIGVKELGKITP